MGSCLDLRKWQSPESVQDAMGKILSGKPGYKPIIERKVEPIKCKSCGKILEGNEKFCPDCGTKTDFGIKPAAG